MVRTGEKGWQSGWKGGFIMEEILELLNAGQYLKLRQMIVNYNVADIAAYMEKMEKEEVLKLFRILPKSMAADVFSYLEIETEQYVITSMSEKDAAGIIDNLMADDATDLLEEMPANVVKTACSCEPGDKKGHQSSAALSGRFRRKHYDGGIC